MLQARVRRLLGDCSIPDFALLPTRPDPIADYQALATASPNQKGFRIIMIMIHQKVPSIVTGNGRSPMIDLGAGVGVHL
jgi:hypothetical protein